MVVAVFVVSLLISGMIQVTIFEKLRDQQFAFAVGVFLPIMSSFLFAYLTYEPPGHDLTMPMLLLGSPLLLAISFFVARAISGKFSQSDDEE